MSQLTSIKTLCVACLTVAFAAVGAGCSAPETTPGARQSTAIDASDVYRFVDEITNAHPHFDPKAELGTDTRTVMARPLDEPGLPHTAYGPPWSPVPTGHTSRWIRLPEAARFDAAVGVRPATDGGADSAVRFALHVESASESREVFATVLEPTNEAAAWTEIQVVPNDFAGQAVRFRFEHTLEQADGDITRALWAAPTLVTADATLPSKPNVILVSLDTLRADHLGAYGYARDTDPHLRAFAEKAVLFEQAIAPSSWTLPSHASVFTGLPPILHRANIFHERLYFSGEHRLLSEIARDAGYRTAAFTEGGWIKPEMGFAQGFELYRAEVLGPESGRSQIVPTFERAEGWLDSTDRQPFFLFVHTYEVHAPYAPPKDYADRYLGDYTGPIGRSVNLHPGMGDVEYSDADWARIESLYDAEIAFTDEVLHGFFESLRKRGLWENSLVVVFSDHGEEFNEHGGRIHGTTLYEEVLRVPLIVKLPGANPPAGRRGAPVSLTDVFATVCEIMGWERDVATEDSASLLNMMLSAQAKYANEFVVSELGPKSGTIAIRSGSQKYILKPDGAQEFYLLDEDPGEQHNRFVELEDGAAPFAKFHRRYMDNIERRRADYPTGGTHPRILSDEKREQMEALGYL